MLFLFNDFLPLRSFLLYIASFELENCQIDSNLSFDVTNEFLGKYHKSSSENINTSKRYTKTILGPKDHNTILNKKFSQWVKASLNYLQINSTTLLKNMYIRLHPSIEQAFLH